MSQGQCSVQMSNIIGQCKLDEDGICGFLQKGYLSQVMPLLIVNVGILCPL